jgi:sugar lactone lactonase YvrE
MSSAPHPRSARPLARAAAIAAIAAGSVLAGCGGTSGVSVAVHSAAPHVCPGGFVTTAGGHRKAPGGGAAGGCPYLSAAAIGKPGEGVFRQPEAIAISPSGKVYVGDQFSHLVQVFSRAGTFEGQWGAAGSGPGEFGAVGGLAFDSQGYVYLVDSTNDRVEKFTPSGRFVSAWGSRGSGVGQFDFGAGNGPSQPPGGGIAVGGPYVYVADTRNDRIQRFRLDGSEARLIAGPGSGPGAVHRPQGLALAPAEGASAPEALYVADNGNARVQALTPAGRFVAQASSFPASPPTFQNPYDVAVRGGSVYVVDDNHARVVRFDRSLRFLGTFSGSGSDELTHFLRADAVDGAGDVYVADASANRIVVFSADGAPLRAWGISGIAPGQFVAPIDVAGGPEGRILVAEAYREIVPLTGGATPAQFRAQIAYGSPWSSGGGVTLGSRFFSPTGLAFARDGTVWVSDRNNDVLRHLADDGHFITAVGAAAADAVPNAPGAAVRLSEPHGVGVAPAGQVFVADTGNSSLVELADDGGMISTRAAPGPAGSRASGRPSAPPFRSPLGVAVGGNGDVYVADTGNRLIDALTPNGALLASWGGSGAASAGPVTGLKSPNDVAVDAAGQVFVVDGGSARVLEYSASGTLLAAWGVPGTAVGELSEPMGLAIDCRGDVLVADTGNNRVQLFVGVAAASGCHR